MERRRWAAQSAKDLRLWRYFQDSWKNFWAVRLVASLPRKVSKRHWIKGLFQGCRR